MDKFTRWVLHRSIFHALGGIAVGFVAGMLHEWFILVGWLFIIVTKEIALDPHPDSRYWWKTAVDITVWTIFSVGVYALYVLISG